MKNILVKFATFLGSSAIGLLVATLVLPGMKVTFWGFIVAVLVFSFLQAIISPLVGSLLEKYASAWTSLIGLISSFLALLISHWLIPGLTLQGAGTWILAALLMWVLPAIATFLLPKVIASGE